MPARHIQLPSNAVFSASGWRSLAIILIVIVVVLVGGLLYIWTKKA